MQLLAHFKELTIHPKNAEELKGLILQLAVQGKLTKNWREENTDTEPSSIILEKIEHEKIQLITDNKIKKEKALPQIDKSISHLSLPSKWSLVQIPEMINGLGLYSDGDWVESKDQDPEGDIRLLQLADIGDGSFRDKSNRFINEEKFQKLNCNEVKKGDVLVARMPDPLGRCCIMPLEKQKYITVVDVCIIRLDQRIHSDWFVYFFNSHYMRMQIESFATGTTRQRISRGNMTKLKIPFPPLEEQKAIVSIVNQLFKEVEELEEQTKARIRLKEDFVTSALQQVCTGDAATEWTFLQEHFKTFFTGKTAVKKLRESILQLAVQGKLTSSWREGHPGHPELVSGSGTHAATALLEKIKAEKAQLVKDKKIKKEKPLPEIGEDEIPYELPDGWVWCRMGEVSDIQRGSSPRPKGDPLYFSESETEYHWISIKDISKHSVNNRLLKTEEFLTQLGTAYSRFVDVNELIVAVSGSTTGKCCLTGIPGFIYDGLAVIRLIGNQIDYNYQLMYMLQLYSHMNDSKFGAAFPNINTKFLSEMMFPFPPVEEQEAIVSKVNTLMALCDSLEKEIKQNNRNMEELMQSCLREVFEGEKIGEVRMAAEPGGEYEL